MGEFENEPQKIYTEIKLEGNKEEGVGLGWGDLTTEYVVHFQHKQTRLISQH